MTPYRQRHEAGEYFGTITTTVDDPDETLAPHHEVEAQEAADTADEIYATRKATERANELGVDLASVQGTGRAGRITVPDVEAAAVF